MKRRFKCWSRILGLVEEIGSMNLTSPSDRVAHTKPDGLDELLTEVRNGAKGNGGVACDRIRQRQAMIGLDIPGELGVSVEQAAAKCARSSWSLFPPKITW